MFLFFFAVRAEVFTLWPYSGGGSVLSSKVDSIPGIDREILLIEPMIVNGVRLKLEVRRIDSTFDNLILFLKGNFDPKELRAAGDTIRVAYKTSGTVADREFGRRETADDVLHHFSIEAAGAGGMARIAAAAAGWGEGRSGCGVSRTQSSLRLL